MNDDTYLMLNSDGKVEAVDLGPMMRRHRAAHVKYRADAIDQAADVAADRAFTADEVREMWEASGLSGDDLDAAVNVALELREIEQLRE